MPSPLHLLHGDLVPTAVGISCEVAILSLEFREAAKCENAEEFDVPPGTLASTCAAILSACSSRQRSGRQRARNHSIYCFSQIRLSRGKPRSDSQLPARHRRTICMAIARRHLPVKLHPNGRTQQLSTLNTGPRLSEQSWGNGCKAPSCWDHQ